MDIKEIDKELDKLLGDKEKSEELQREKCKLHTSLINKIYKWQEELLEEINPLLDKLKQLGVNFSERVYLKDNCEVYAEIYNAYGRNILEISVGDCQTEIPLIEVECEELQKEFFDLKNFKENMKNSILYEIKKQMNNKIYDWTTTTKMYTQQINCLKKILEQI